MKKELFHHQRRALDLAADNASRLIFRLPGTGKTLIGIELVRRELERNPAARILWIGPANLLNQYQNAFGEFSQPCHSVFPEKRVATGCCNLSSYDMVRLQCGFFCGYSWDMIICDEIHKAKSDATQTNHALWKLRKKCDRWYSFTGTPFQNNPYEFFELVSLCLNRRITVECEMLLQYRRPKSAPIRNFLRRLGFKLDRLNQGPIVGIREPQKLHEILTNVVDYVKPDDYLGECHLPVVNSDVINVPLTADEEEKYTQILRQISRKKKFQQFANDDMGDEFLEGYFKGLSGLRTVALQESKQLATINLLKEIMRRDEQARILVFCNFVEMGLNRLSQKLKECGIAHLLYNGQVPMGKRGDFVRQYLSGEKRILLLSPVGFEGLDLYGTTNIVIMDPHYNPERTKQLVSRAIRAFTQVSSIQITHLISQSKKIKMPLVDEQILKISQRKSRVAKMLEDVLAMSEQPHT